MPFQPGEVLAGKYKVIDLIGTGGVAFVISARHTRLGESVALKFLRPELATHEEAVQRFTIEARVNFKLSSPHVVRVLDVEALPDGTPFMIMELLDGTDLGRWLDEQGALPVERAVEYVRQACEGLASAHAAYVVHRDIKPANLFLTRTAQGVEQIKLLDFGISKVPRPSSDKGGAVGATSTILGSPPYMSPEQVRGSSETDARTDIWSMGCVLYELIAGVTPFERDSVIETCEAIQREPAQPISKLCPNIPLELEAIIMRCLSSNPDDRFQHIEDLTSALAAFTQQAEQSRTSHARMVIPPAAPSESEVEEVSMLLPTRGGSIKTWLLAATLVAVMVGGIMSMRSGESTARDSAPVPRAASESNEPIAAAPSVPQPPMVVADVAPAPAPAPAVEPVRAPAIAAKPKWRAAKVAPPSEPDVGF